MPRPKKNVALRRKCAKIATEASVVAVKQRRQAASSSEEASPPPHVASCSREPTSAQKRKSLVTEQKEQPEASEMKIRCIIYEETVKEIVESMLCPLCCQNNATGKFTHHQIHVRPSEVFMWSRCSGYYQVKEYCYPMTTLLVYCMM